MICAFWFPQKVRYIPRDMAIGQLVTETQSLHLNHSGTIMWPMRMSPTGNPFQILLRRDTIVSSEVPMKVRGQRVLDPKERLMSFVRVNPDTGCWEWMGAKKGKAKLKQYGSLVVGSRSSGGRKTVSAHRYAYEVFIGPIPPGLWVLHKCDNPPCINPDHLFLGDRMDNTRDRDSKGRNKIMYADTNGQALLTNEQVISIRSE